MQRLPLRASIIVKNVEQNASEDDILRPLFPAQLWMYNQHYLGVVFQTHIIIPNYTAC